MTKLRTFLRENSDIVWPALCLFFCCLAILFAALKREEIEIEDNAGAISIIKNNRVNIIEVHKGN